MIRGACAVSVINKMLKDLDKRQQPHHVRNIPALSQHTTPAAGNKLPRLIIILLSALGAGFYLRLSLPDKRAVNSDAAAVVKSAPASEKTAVTQITAPKARITEPEKVQTDNLNTDNKAAVLPERASQAEPQLNADKAALALTAEPRTASDEQGLKPVTKPVTGASPGPRRQSVLEIKPVKLPPAALAKKFAKQGQDAELSGNLSLARENYAKALKLNAAMHSVRSKLAALYYGERNNAAAVRLLTTGIEAFPRQAEFRLVLAKIQLKENKPRQALVTLDAIADGDNLAPEKWIRQGTIAQRQKLYSQAVTAFKKLTVFEPSAARWWLGLGYNQDASGLRQPAAEAYRNALRLPGLSDAGRNYIVSRLAQIAAGK